MTFIVDLSRLNSPALWEDTNGRVVCSNHLGHYGVQLLAKRPGAGRLSTPLGEWVRFGVADTLEWLDIVGGNGCESCRSGWAS
jgi:hypothetical protein